MFFDILDVGATILTVVLAAMLTATLVHQIIT